MPVAVRLMTFSLCNVPVRLAATVTPLAQFAVTVPAIDVSVCAVMLPLHVGAVAERKTRDRGRAPRAGEP